MDKEKLKRFLADEIMAKSVQEVLLKAFLKPRGGDVNLLAASRLAIDFLADGWRELEKYRTVDNEEVKTGKNVGL